MAESDDIKEQIRKIRETLVKADERLLDGQLNEDIYKQITQGKLEMLKILESKLPPEKSGAEVQKELDELMEMALKKVDKKIVDDDEYCCVCEDNDYHRKAPHVKIKTKLLDYGIFCYDNKGFLSLGALPLPKHIQSYLQETGYFESQKEDEEE